MHRALLEAVENLKKVALVAVLEVGELLHRNVDYGIIKKSGSWFSYGETRLGQGRDAVKRLIKDNVELAEEIENKIAEALKTANEENM